MPMDAGIRALIEDTDEGLGAEFKRDRARIAALESPLYAGVGRSGSYDPERGIYMASETSLSKTRRALSRAVSGEARFSMVCLGDSSLVGTNGSIVQDRFSIPKQIALCLSMMCGAPRDTGLTAVPQALSTISDRVTSTGSILMTGPFVSIPNDGTWTYETEDAGDEVVIMYTGLSSNFNYQIDGAAAVGVTPPGTSTYHTEVISSLSDTTHKIFIDPTGAGGTYAFIVAIWVRKSTAAISVHNMAFGGSRAAHGGNNNSWTTNTGVATALSAVRSGMRTHLNLNPSTVLHSIGPNDLFNDDTAANALAGLEAMMNFYPDADHIIASGVYFPTTDVNEIAAYTEGKFALADEYNATVVDWRALMEDFEVSLDDGILGPDDAHPDFGVARQMAAQIATMIFGAGGLAVPAPPQPIVLQTGTTYTIKESDNGRRIRFLNAAATTVTVPNTLSARFKCEWEQFGAGVPTFSPGSGVTLRGRGGALKSAGQYAAGGVDRIDSDEFLVYGDTTT